MTSLGLIEAFAWYEEDRGFAKTRPGHSHILLYLKILEPDLSLLR